MDRDTACKILRIDRDARPSDIDAAFKRMVRRYPPEFKPEKFARIKLAYEVLTTARPIIEMIKKNPEKALFEILGVKNPLDEISCSGTPVPCARTLSSEDFSDLIDLHRRTWPLSILLKMFK